MLRKTSLVLLLLSLSAPVGCSSATATDDPDATRITKTCGKTRCDALRAKDSQACSRCLSACSDSAASCNPGSACSISCGRPTECTEDDRAECVSTGFEVTLPETKSEALEKACLSSLARNARCGTDTTQTAEHCAVWARTERPERATAYDCAAALPCNATAADASACAIPPTDFGARLCAALDAKCGPSCSNEVRAALDMHGGWLRDSVMHAAMECTQQPSCSEAKACFEAWASAARL